MKTIIDNYQKYRWFVTLSGKLVVGGKNSKQNDDLLRTILSNKKELIIMHTSSPGSPFSVILENIDKIKKEDIEETAIFTACFSQAWKSGKSKARIDIFKTSQLYKDKKMNEGTWGVKREIERVIVPLELVLTKQRGMLRAVPEAAAKRSIIKIIPGKITKEEMTTKLATELKEKLSHEEIISALPSGGFKILR